MSRMKHELLTREYDFSPKCQLADGAAYLCYVPDCFLGNLHHGNCVIIVMYYQYECTINTLYFQD